MVPAGGWLPGERFFIAATPLKGPLPLPAPTNVCTSRVLRVRTWVQIPLGEVAPVAGTVMDFTAPTPIGLRCGVSWDTLLPCTPVRVATLSFSLPPSPLPGCAPRVMEVDGGGLPGYDHCYSRLGPGEPYDPRAGEVEIAR